MNYVSESLQGEDVCNVQTGNGSEELPEFLCDMFRELLKETSTKMYTPF